MSQGSADVNVAGKECSPFQCTFALATGSIHVKGKMTIFLVFSLTQKYGRWESRQIVVGKRDFFIFEVFFLFMVNQYLR